MLWMVFLILLRAVSFNVNFIDQVIISVKSYQNRRFVQVDMVE